jgi:hypothetical protein
LFFGPILTTTFFVLKQTLKGDRKLHSTAQDVSDPIYKEWVDEGVHSMSLSVSLDAVDMLAAGEVFGVLRAASPLAAKSSKTAAVVAKSSKTAAVVSAKASKATAVVSANKSARPSSHPSLSPSMEPSSQPSSRPSSRPSEIPSLAPSSDPSSGPSMIPSSNPSGEPSSNPTSPPVHTFLQVNISSDDDFNGQTANLAVQETVQETVQDGGVPKNVVCGAVQAVLAHPTEANVCFAGGVNGGVWKTTSCTSPLPHWVPLTDNKESNSVGDMVFGDTPDTVLVATGTRSSLAEFGGRGIGLLLTDNALDPLPTWKVLDNGKLFRDWNLKFNSVYMQGNLILASAYTSGRDGQLECDKVGIWRSNDRGDTWAQVLKGVGRAIAHDPNDISRFYAVLDNVRQCTENDALPENGVFTSTDSGATWNAVTSPGAPVPGGQLSNAKLSVSRDGSRIWSVIFSDDGKKYIIAFSDNNGGSWTNMDNICIPTADEPWCGLGDQGNKHLSMLASPTNKNEVYVGGTSQLSLPNHLGATNFNGLLFRGDAEIQGTGGTPSPQWEHLTHSNIVQDIPEGGTVSNSAPHADSRDMVLRADGAILEGDDGGITIRTSPSDNTGDWFGLCGNMQVFEAHNLAYEPVFKTV